jgi:hypothetical protein
MGCCTRSLISRTESSHQCVCGCDCGQQTMHHADSLIAHSAPLALDTSHPLTHSRDKKLQQRCVLTQRTFLHRQTKRRRAGYAFPSHPNNGPMPAQLLLHARPMPCPFTMHFNAMQPMHCLPQLVINHATATCAPPCTAGHARTLALFSLHASMPAEDQIHTHPPLLAPAPASPSASACTCPSTTRPAILPAW